MRSLLDAHPYTFFTKLVLRVVKSAQWWIVSSGGSSMRGMPMEMGNYVHPARAMTGKLFGCAGPRWPFRTFDLQC